MLFVNVYYLIFTLLVITLVFIAYLLYGKKQRSELSKLLKFSLSFFVIASSFIAYYFSGGIVEINKLDKLQDSQKMVFAIISNLEEVVSKNPSDAKGLYLLGKMYLKINKDKQALEVLKKAYDLDKNNIKYQTQYFWTKFMINNSLSLSEINSLKKSLKKKITDKQREDINNLLSEQ